ncbi:hypothetical protein TeGR_g3150 [Tetraparma gracilis]|uniref:Uncharacterized protein n=1 Tax=Tetraparma gracilis TaxID=2962635 RepID=A0ABQ6MJF1_9STRA|nr:hypothetical protein TeGR_g3150 [Tetraparma gracilis]
MSLNSTGHDPKSLLWNLVMIFVFLCPIPLYRGDISPLNCALAALGLYAAAYLATPMGWKRPHQYSDMPSNRLPRDKSK